MTEINITNHGYDRILERTHCKRKDIKNHIARVWGSGKKIEDYSSKKSMMKYLKNVCSAGGDDRSVRVKGNILYLFNKCGTAFITCYQIPDCVLHSLGR